MTDEHGMQATIRESLDFFLSGRILNGQISTGLNHYPRQTGRLDVDEFMNKHVYPETGETWDDMEETIFHELEKQMTKIGIAQDFDNIYQKYNNDNRKTFIRNRVKKIFSEDFLFFINRIEAHILYNAASSLVKMHEPCFADIMTVYKLGGMPCGFEGAPFRSRLIVYVPS
ncbi:hypothetical protein P7L75_00445 (plasmid) [Tistrella mobilis]|uniref:hypothetical protein n=1 Tax=Tistrella mobilis TaxID=171437 RepID=UPI00355859A0